MAAADHHSVTGQRVTVSCSYEDEQKIAAVNYSGIMIESSILQQVQ
jgi:tRNA(Glu) U13 pseudouridine synthase TruD